MATKKPVLLGPDGAPIERRALTRELTAPEFTGIRTLWYDSVAPGLTPQRLAGILKAAEEGNHLDYLALAQDMEERELHYTSVLSTRKRAIAAIEPVVEAASEDAADIALADAIEDLIEQPPFASLLEHLVDAIGKGYAVSEIMWETSAKQWMPYDYRARDPRFFTFDIVDRTEMRLMSLADPIHGEAMAPFKFVRHVPHLKSGIPIRGGLAKPAAWAFIFKAYSLKDWVAFAEVYGMPIRVGKYGPMATPEDRAKLLSAVRNIGTDAAAIIPATMELEFVEAAGGKGSGGAAVFKDLCDYLDKQVSKLVLGQTMTTDHGSSMAQAKVHENVRHDIKEADAKQLETTLNRDIIRPYIDLNHGPQASYPRVRLPIPKPEDLTALATNLKTLVPLGMRVAEQEVREKFGLSEPDEGAAILTGAGLVRFDKDAVPDLPEPTEIEDDAAEIETPIATEDDDEVMPARKPAKPVAKARKAANTRRTTAKKKAPRKVAKKGKAKRAVCASCGVAHNTAEAPSHGDALDELRDHFLSDWQPIADPLLAPLRDAVNAAGSYDEFLAALPKAMARMDANTFVETLASAMAIARGLGSVGTDAHRRG